MAPGKTTNELKYINEVTGIGPQRGALSPRGLCYPLELSKKERPHQFNEPVSALVKRRTAPSACFLA